MCLYKDQYIVYEAFNITKGDNLLDYSSLIPGIRLLL